MRWGWIVVGGILALAIIAALVLPIRMRNGSMRMPVAMTAAQLARAAPAADVDLVVQVQSVRPGGTTRAWLLQSVSPSQYTRTRTAVWIDRSPATKTVMGSASDVISGAVLQVHAIATGRMLDGYPVVEASQIVIISGFATVQ
jgi:hypothetical protein